jgi:2-methylcitrate dehydratase PrpD
MLETMGEFVSELSYKKIPSDVVQMAKSLVLHHLYTGYSGVYEAESQIALSIVQDYGGKNGKSTVLGLKEKYPMQDASFANAVLMHSIQQEDTYKGLHPGPHTIPAALAIAEHEPATGKEILTSIVAGYEINLKLGEICAGFTSPRGWRGTTIFGVVGAAATAAKILDISTEKVNSAMAMAINTASGLMQCWLSGTDEWLYASGLASKNGVLAGLLARAGTTGATDSFEGARGYFKAYCGEEPKDLTPVAEDLGKEYSTLKMIMKPYSVITTILPVIHNTLSLVEEENIHAKSVKEVHVAAGTRVTQGPLASSILDMGPYVNKTQAFKSLPCAIGIALEHREVSAVTANRYKDSEIAQLAEKVTITTDEQAEGFFSTVTIKTEDGKSYSRSGDEFPNLTHEQVKTNLVQAAEKFTSPEKAKSLVQAIEDIENISITDLSELLM